MAGNVIEFTDSNWQSEVLIRIFPSWSTFGPLGAALPDLAPTIESSPMSTRQGQNRQVEHRREPGDSRRTADLSDSDGLDLQGGEEVDRLVGVNTESKFRSSLEKLGVS